MHEPRWPKDAPASQGGENARNQQQKKNCVPPSLPLSISTKKLEATLYEMGRTFNNLSSTRLATTEFLRTGNPDVLGSLNDLALLRDLRDAARYVTRYDYANKPFDLAYLKGINGSMTRSAAINAGVLRKHSNVVVTLADGSAYVPPVPDPAELDQTMHKADCGKDLVRSASCLFASVAKAQPFGDGNKRTALLAANGLLLKHKLRNPLTVPTDPKDTKLFNELLSSWYKNSDPTVIGWLAGWNRKKAKNS